MIISLAIGMIIGATMVVFAFQNPAVVTVTFLQWQFTEPIAFLVLACTLSGIAISLLGLLPFAIHDEIIVRTTRRQKRALESEFAAYRLAHPGATPHTPPDSGLHESRIFA